MLIRHLSSVAFAPTALAYIRQSSGAGKGGCRALGAFEIASMDLMAGEHGVVAVRWGVIAVQIGRGRRANQAWSPCESGVFAVQIERGSGEIGRGRRANGRGRRASLGVVAMLCFEL